MFQAAMFRWLAEYTQSIHDVGWKRSIERWYDEDEQESLDYDEYDDTVEEEGDD